MTDEDFIALSVDDAEAYLAIQNDAGEVQRLRGLRLPSPDLPSAQADLTPVSRKSQSLMRDIGRIGTIASFILGATFLAVSSAQTSAGNGIASLAMGLGILSLVGTFSFMWMIGTLEIRLIEIRDRMASAT